MSDRGEPFEAFVRRVAPEHADLILAERDRWREEAWRCYVASGADPDWADARHLNPDQAVAAVRELMADYHEALKEIPLAEAHPRVDDSDQLTIEDINTILGEGELDVGPINAKLRRMRAALAALAD